MTELKQWRCKSKHILGFIRWNGNGIPQLMVLRQALDMEAAHPSDVDLIGPLDGRMPVRCSICDDVQVWEISVDGMVALMMAQNDKFVLEFSQRLLEASRKVVDLDDPIHAESLKVEKLKGVKDE
jgi:hypothetical protein